jgi:hypothetical protein
MYTKYQLCIALLLSSVVCSFFALVLDGLLNETYSFDLITVAL